MKIIKEIAKALMEVDSGERSCPDYEEMARVALKILGKRLKRKAK